MTQLLVVALLPLALLAASPAPSCGQSPAPPAIAVAAPDVIQEITLRDGTRAFGRVERVAEGRVVFRTLAGATLDIAAADVLQVAVPPAAWPVASSGGPIPIRRASSSDPRRAR